MFYYADITAEKQGVMMQVTGVNNNEVVPCLKVLKVPSTVISVVLITDLYCDVLRDA